MVKETKQAAPAVDPAYDMETKKTIHERADAKNFIEVRRGKAVLCCGGKKNANKGGAACRALAGMGTDHPGYSRCKFCGGCSTGPKTEAGKAATKNNATIHGLYRQVLNKEEQSVFDQVAASKTISLENEIYMLKAKILSYLEVWRDKNRKRRALVESENGDYTQYEVYHAGSIEDRPFLRSLDQLRRLVDSQAKLTQTNGEDIISQINSELRNASEGKVTVSWGGKPQTRQGEGDILHEPADGEA